MIGIVLAAVMAVGAGERELESRLPEIFAKSAAHYRALDAAARPQMTNTWGSYCTPHSYNAKAKTLAMHDIRWWTAGHFPGTLWYLYEATGDAAFRDRATFWTELLAPNAKVTDNHDVGFIMYCSYGNARRLTKTKKYDALLKETAQSLCQRYNKKLGLIRSWGPVNGTNDFLVIPDNLMNLELLTWANAAGLNKDAKGGFLDYNQVARSHADVTMANHYRPDGGCYHVLDYDQKTGKVKGYKPGQGASTTTAWARGQSWSVYGYTMMFRTTGCIRYLDFAKKLADYAMGHPNMPEDGIPYWDYGRPGEERDASAGAILASALIELSQYVGEQDRARYRAFAVKELLALASSDYYAEGDEVGHFLLKHSVGNKPGKSEVDVPLDYADYYFLEALLRFRNLKKREAACAKVAALLPEKARLPADELNYRSRVAARIERDAKNVAAIMADAKAALRDAIPDTSDELYVQYWEIGDRANYEKVFFRRLRYFDALVLALEVETRRAEKTTSVRQQEKTTSVQQQEGTTSVRQQEKIVARIEDYIAAFCEMKSWVLPAHDWGDGGKGTFKGTWLSTDLFGSEVAAHLACCVQLMGDKLKPETIARVKQNVERRIFSSVRRETPRALFADTAIPGVSMLQNGWINGYNNWNAVCWDNVVCAACGLVDDPMDRAFFVTAADRAVDTYIKKGFASDGYCSEGMGYWNYGFGHHLMTGRMLNRLTGGKSDFFRRPGQRMAAAYARAYTLREGFSPAFADGNGAAQPLYLGLVDEFWPDLPKTLPPESVFPVGQVWLYRDQDGLSVAFKGGNNNEHHNHNDLGSYWLMVGDQFVAGDPGKEVYTRRTFSKDRYQSKVLNSYGHPVPVIGGKLQRTGAAAQAKVANPRAEDGAAVKMVTLDLTSAYDVKTLKRYTRMFLYDRERQTFTVRDHAEFSAPTTFEDCYVTLGGEVKVAVKATAKGTTSVQQQEKTTSVRQQEGTTSVQQQDLAAVAKGEETIENPGLAAVHRFAWTFEKPVMAADVEFVFSK